MAAAYVWLWKVFYSSINYVRIYDLQHVSDSKDIIGTAPSISVIIPLDGKSGQVVKIFAGKQSS